MFVKNCKFLSFLTVRKNLILVIYCCVLLLILGLFTSAYQSFIRNILYQGVVENVSAVTAQGIGRLKAIMDGHMRLIFSFKHYIEENSIDFTGPVSGKQKYYIDGILEHNNYASTCISKSSGITSCYDGQILDMSENRCFSESMKGKTCISTPYMDAEGTQLISVTAPLDYESGAMGVLIITAKLKNIYETFNIDFYDDSGYSYILDANGNMLIDSPMHPRGVDFRNFLTYLEDNGNDPDTIEQIRSDMKNGFSGISLVDSAGQQKFISYTPFYINDNKLYFIALVPENVVLQNENMIMFYTTLLCVLVILVVMGIFLYISIANRIQRKKTFKLAYYDSFSGLYNKHYLEEFCKSHLTDKFANYASVAIDINHFKVFNHLRGYDSGDFILKIMGNVFKDSMHSGEMASRVNNDVFCLILKYDKQSHIVTRVTEIVDKIRKELKTNPDLINNRITFACGIYAIPHAETDCSAIFDNADIARQYTKSSGKSWITFYRKSMISQMKNEQEIENIMEDALKNNEFEVYLQPKVSFETFMVIGAEALVRWKRPDHGIVSPANFIPVFERTGFVTQLDFYVFEKTCIALNKWRKEGKMLDIIVSVNMSRNHLGQDYFIDVLSLIAERWEIPLSSLEIEITESAFFEDSEHLIKILNKLKSVGFRLSMDDFGAGYSSLNMLKSVPIDVLKIDKEFLDQSGVSEKSRIIIASIIHMSKSINVEVVCEGVETEEQAEFLRNVGCDYAQGYLYSKPLTLQDFYDFVQKVNIEKNGSLQNVSYRYFYGANI